MNISKGPRILKLRHGEKSGVQHYFKMRFKYWQSMWQVLWKKSGSAITCDDLTNDAVLQPFWKAMDTFEIMKIIACSITKY